MDNRPVQDREEAENSNLVASQRSRTYCYFGLFILFLVLAMMFFGSAASTKNQSMKTAAFIAGCMSMFLTVGFLVCATDKKNEFRNLHRQNARLRAARRAVVQRQQEENAVNEDNEQPPAEPENDEQGASEDNEQRPSQQVDETVNESLRSRRVVKSLNDLRESLRTEFSMLSSLRLTASIDELFASRRGNESDDSGATQAMDELLASRQAIDSADSATAVSENEEPSELAANHEDKQNPSPEAAEGLEESSKFTPTPLKESEFEMKSLHGRQ